MYKEELLKQYDEKAKALRDEFISKLEDDKKEFELTYPMEDENVYYIVGNSMDIEYTFFWNGEYNDRTTFEHGLYFETREEAERYLKERKLLFKLQQWAKEKNDGWEPDWEDNEEEKWTVYFNYSFGDLTSASTRLYRDIVKLPYFKTREISDECVNLFGKEIKEVLC
nr:MAG TPA: hypothetical protein [Caudoviricetes sp.]